MIGICDSPPGLNFERPRPSSALSLTSEASDFLLLMQDRDPAFHSKSDSDRDFYSNAYPDPALKNIADINPQPCFCCSARVHTDILIELVISEVFLGRPRISGLSKKTQSR